MIIAFIFLLVIPSKALTKESVVYGQDNRKDVFQTYNYLHKMLAHSTAGMISNQRISIGTVENSIAISSKHKIGKALNLCSSERFINQNLLAKCSGFLVRNDILVTAGHCLAYDKERPQKDACRDNSWVFGLHMEDSNNINLESISNDRVYKCKKILKLKRDKFEDYAVIKLDRRVVGIRSLRYRTSGKIKSSAKLVVIGHPSMLPTKITDNGSILDNNNPYKFYTNLDTFQGSSGSAVFDSKTGLLEGLLVSGKTDYIVTRPNDSKSCRVVNTCNHSGSKCDFTPEKGTKEAKGEAVTRITTLTRYFRYN